MGPLITRGKRPWRLLFLVTLATCATYAQTPSAFGTCAVTSVPTQVRSEGLAERLGDINLQCSGSTPGAVLTGNLSVALPVAITNRVNDNSQTTDAVLSADFGSGPVALPIAGQVSGNIVAFQGLNLTVPASGSFALRISNLRAAVNQLGLTNTQPVQASISASAPLLVNQAVVVVAYANPALLTTLYDHGAITCVGSALPSTLSLSNLFAQGTNFASARLTEGFASAFQPRGTGDDTGTRFLIKYSGFPAGAQLYVPDMVAGSTAAVATAGGDLGVPQAVGQYVPGSGTLLLVRVPYADQTGAGYPTTAPAGSDPIALNTVSQVPLTNGSGYVVYEVVDSNPALRESVQIPTFIGMPANTTPTTANESVTLAPVSNVVTASTSAPIPRFWPVVPSSDCASLGDCSASYFPKLSVTVAGSIQLTAIAGGAMTSDQGYIAIKNTAGGVMPWTATVQYINGTGWLSVGPTSGMNNGSVNVIAVPKGLSAGTYQANILIDAGAMAGSVTVPVTLTVSPAPGTGTGSGTTGTGTGTSGSTPTSTPQVTVSRVVNAATFNPTPLVAGSLGTAMGTNLGGKIVAVTFDGTAAKLIYTGANQINFQVPDSLAGKNSATMVVTVDGVSSAPQTVVLAPAWPAIFSGGVLNQDYSANAAASGAKAGSYISIWATGIPEGATVSVQMGDRKGLVPAYAGAAPDVPGVQQVNVAIPDDMPAGTTPLVVCAATGTLNACSPAYALTVGQ